MTPRSPIFALTDRQTDKTNCSTLAHAHRVIKNELYPPIALRLKTGDKKALKTLKTSPTAVVVLIDGCFVSVVTKVGMA